MVKKEINELEKVSVKSHSELTKALEPFMADTTIYKLLVEGMDLVKRQNEFAERAVIQDNESFGGFMPAKPSAGNKFVWVDTLIERRMDGKRDGLKVKWSIPDGDFEFDPWTRKLEKIK